MNDQLQQQIETETEQPIDGAIEPISIEQFIAKHQITIEARFINFATEVRGTSQDDYKWDHFTWEVTLLRAPYEKEYGYAQDIKKRLATPWRAGAAHLEYRYYPRGAQNVEWRRHSGLSMELGLGAPLYVVWNAWGGKKHKLPAQPLSVALQLEKDGALWNVSRHHCETTDMKDKAVLYGGSGLWLRPTPPTAATVLDCLASDATTYDNRTSFKEFCADYGYNDDSIRDKELYERVVESGRKLAEWLGREAFEELLYKVERLYKLRI